MEEVRKEVRKPALLSGGGASLQQSYEHGKVQPQAVDLEEAVLGAMMIEKDAVSAVIDILSPKVFYKDSHQRIFAAISELFTESEPIDIPHCYQ